MRERLFQIVQRARPGDKVSHVYDIFIVAVAFVSIIPLMFRPQDAGPELTAVLNMVDVVTVYVLFFDYIMRWATHDLKTGKKGWKEFAKYPFTLVAIIDLLAILPSLGVLPETFKFLRVLRVTKIFRYSKNLTIVANVFRSEKNTLLSVLVVALMYIFVSGLIMFVNEPETFDNFFDALYWATTALTTVGYGDVYPTTDLGKFISMASSLFGIAVIALPAGIITGGFLEQIRQSQEDREIYFHHTEHQPFKGRTLASYGSLRAYVKAHPKVVAYAVTMIACVLLNEALYGLASAYGTPVWLDTVGTALAAILLEPAAALIVGFVNNLVLAIQFGSAGDLLYYSLSAITALVFGLLFARGKKIELRSFGWALLLIVVVETVISWGLALVLYGGGLTTPMQMTYGAFLEGIGLPSGLAVFGALLIDKLADTAAVFVIVLALSRGIIGSRIDPARWFGNSAHAGRDFATAAETIPATEVSSAEESHPSQTSARYVLGIDVGGTHTKIGAFTVQGELVATHVFDSQRVLNDGSHAQLSSAIVPVLQKANVDPTCVQSIGLAVPGSVAAEESLKMCPHLDLDLRSYKAFLHAMFPKARVVVLNDADAAVLGNRWRGSEDGSANESIAFVTLGTGVGAGIVAKGKLLTSKRGAVGELGHLTVNPSEEESCACGKKGCLEQYASGTGLVRLARNDFAARAQEAADEDAAPEAYRQAAVEAFPDVRSVFEAVDRHDPSACAALDGFSDALGFGLAQVASLLDPDEFVLGGGLSERADLFLNAVRARYRACVVSVCRDTPIVVSSLRNECGVYGAAYQALAALGKDDGTSNVDPAVKAAAAAAVSLH